MVDRRSFITSTIALATAVAVENATEARPIDAAPELTDPAVALVDRSLRGSAVFAAAARARGVRTLEFTGDVAALWMREVEPRLRSGPVAIEGYTSGATCFCLDLLARDFGARTVQRTAEAGAVSSVISQTPGRRAALAPPAARAYWSARQA